MFNEVKPLLRVKRISGHMSCQVAIPVGKPRIAQAWQERPPARPRARKLKKGTPKRQHDPLDVDLQHLLMYMPACKGETPWGKRAPAGAQTEERNT